MDRLSARARQGFRLAAATLVVAVVHVALVALLCLTPPRDTHRTFDAGPPSLSISLVTGRDAPAATPAPPAAKVEPPRPAEAELPDGAGPQSDRAATPQLSQAETLALAAFHPDLGGGQAPGCNLAHALADTFTGSPEVRQSLDELPVSQRSVANAVMLWDGQWSQDSLSGGKALLRALLIKAVAGARPECLSAVNHGPVLFYVPDAAATVVIAVGSGDWRWGDLMAPAGAAPIIS